MSSLYKSMCFVIKKVVSVVCKTVWNVKRNKYIGWYFITLTKLSLAYLSLHIYGVLTVKHFIPCALL